MNSFGTLFPDKIFFADISLTVNIIPDMFQIPWHFQVFQTSGHPVWFCHMAKVHKGNKDKNTTETKWHWCSTV